MPHAITYLYGILSHLDIAVLAWELKKYAPIWPCRSAHVAQQSEFMRILCSNEQGKLCFRRTKTFLSDGNHLPYLTVRRSCSKVAKQPIRYILCERFLDKHWSSGTEEYLVNLNIPVFIFPACDDDRTFLFISTPYRLATLALCARNVCQEYEFGSGAYGYNQYTGIHEDNHRENRQGFGDVRKLFNRSFNGISVAI